jgi:hypothetical protein
MTVVDGVTAAINALCQRRGLICNVERKVLGTAAILRSSTVHATTPDRDAPLQRSISVAPS